VLDTHLFQGRSEGIVVEMWRIPAIRRAPDIHNNLYAVLRQEPKELFNAQVTVTYSVDCIWKCLL